MYISIYLEIYHTNFYVLLTLLATGEDLLKAYKPAVQSVLEMKYCFNRK